MRQIFNKLSVLTLALILTVTSIYVPVDVAYSVAFGGSGKGQSASSGGGTAGGTFSTTRQGVRVYIANRDGKIVSRVIDIVNFVPSNFVVPGQDIVYFTTRLETQTPVYTLSWANSIITETDLNNMCDFKGNGGKWIMPLSHSNASGFFSKGEELKEWLLKGDYSGTTYNPSGSSSDTNDYDGQNSSTGTTAPIISASVSEQMHRIKTQMQNVYNLFKQAEFIFSKETAINAAANTGYNIVNGLKNSGKFSNTEIALLSAAVLDKINELEALDWGGLGLLKANQNNQESFGAQYIDSLIEMAYASDTGDKSSDLLESGNLIPLLEMRRSDGSFMFSIDGNIPISTITKQLSDGTLYSGESICKTCQDNDLVVMMEPLAAFVPQSNGSHGYARYANGNCMFYGTPVNFGHWLTQMDKGDWTDGNGMGGNLISATNSGMPWCMYLDEPLEFNSKTIRAVQSSDTTSVTSNTGGKLKVFKNETIANAWIGHSLHVYEFSPDDGIPTTTTYDPNPDPNTTPHPAPDPDPSKIPLTGGENPMPETPENTGYKQTTRTINIVKVYDIEKLDGTIEHVTTTVRNFNPIQISIQHEPDYKVVGYFTSTVYAGDLFGWQYSQDLIEGTEWYALSGSPEIPQTEGAVYEWDNVKDKKAKDTEAFVKLGLACDCNPDDPKSGKHYNDNTLYVHLLKKEKPIETHTFDDPNSPGPAPDPRDPDEGGPLTEPEEEQAKFNIVKVYETEDENGNITTDGVYDRQNTAGIITIEDEKNEPSKYELIQWQYSLEHQVGSDWDSCVNGTTVLGSGRAPTKVDIRNPSDLYESRTLYVRLRRVETEPLVAGDIIIQQSQISKAIHTDDKVIGGRWGNYEFVATIGDFTRSHITYYDHGCCGSCDPPCGSCHGHTCYLEMPGRSGDNKLTFVFDQIGAEVSLQVKTGVHSSTDPKVYTPNGVHPKTIPGMTAAGNVNEFVSDGNQSNGAELVTVLWRGGATPTDIPTLALYKKNDITNRYGSTNYEIPQAMLKNASNTSKKTRASAPSVYSLSITFGIDQGVSDLQGTASCVTHNGDSCIYTDTRRVYMIAGTQFNYEFLADVGVQFYAGRPKGLAAQPFGGQSTSVIKQSTGNHFENNIIQGKQQIKFFPYIKMTYMTNSLKLAELEEQNIDTYAKKTRYETYVLSEWESSILPSDAIEVGWTNNNEKESILMTSQQWSLHQKAVNGGQSWNGTNQVLPGGAIYQLSTPNDRHTNVKIVTYQTVVDQKTRQYLSQALTGTEYTEKQVAKDHTDFVNDAKEVLDNLRIVQWVNKDVDDTYAWNNNWDEIPGSGALCVRGGGESLSELGLTGKSSTEAKYYMHKAGNLISYQSAELGDKTADLIGDGETASEGDLDIISINQVTTVFKVFTDTAGNVYMASVQQNGTDNEAIITSLVNQLKDVNADTVAMGQTGGATISDPPLADRTVTAVAINGVLSGDAKQIDDRTGFITNIVSALTRNKGTDKTAAWATNDGNWYNEAFDGIYLVRQATTLEIGLAYSSQRTSALDPALCPPNAGQSDLYSTAFLSQFCLNDQSDAAIAADKDERYLGTFKGKDITLPDMEGMYQSRKFYIPNANVQDLN